MIHIKRFIELNENVGVPKTVRPEKLPYCSVLQTKGYRIAEIGGQKYAFDKRYEVDDEIYWLGQNNINYKYGKKYIATPDVTKDKSNNPFYSLYCKCDPSLTDEERKKILDRDKELEKEKLQKEKEKEKKIKEKKRKSKKR